MDDYGIDRSKEELARYDKAFKAAVWRGIERAGYVIHTEARKNAPRGPSKAQIAAERKSGRKPPARVRKRSPLATAKKLIKKVWSKVSKLWRRKGAATRTPGGLEKSIEMEKSEGKGVSIFVAANSYAGKYARRIHDEKGKTWFNRGPGTRAKGDRADEKFIQRAADGNKDLIQRLIDDETGKVNA